MLYFYPPQPLAQAGGIDGAFVSSLPAVVSLANQTALADEGGAGHLLPFCADSRLVMYRK